MNLIELHILQSFPVTCLNRDDLGAPKTAYFGGCQRARVSSQSWKRAIRSLAREEAPNLFAGQRTRFLVRSLKQGFAKQDYAPEEAQILSMTVADVLGKLDDPQKGNVKTLLYFSPQELEQVIENMQAFQPNELVKLLAQEDLKKKEKEKKEKELKSMAAKAAKALKSRVKDNADIAVFGRMVADDHSLMLEGAGLFSHALSTHRVSNEIDFFSAVDDNNQEGDEGAGHIGTLEYNSACYYRYIGLNIDLFKDDDHLGHFSEEEQAQVMAAFIKSAVMAVPTARKNSMFGFNPPAYVLGLRREGQPLSLVNAFEKPVQSSNQGYISNSIDALKAHWDVLCQTYCLTDQVRSGPMLRFRIRTSMNSLPALRLKEAPMEPPVLTLYLNAPLQSWGYQSHFDQRTSYSMPTRSGILGMIGAALGMERNQPQLLSLFQELKITVLAFGIALRITDFHTVGGGWDKKSQPLHMVKKPEKSAATVVTHREYLQDAKFGVLLAGPEDLLTKIGKALTNPKWGIWLGRKSCIPASPVFQGIFDSLEKAEAHLVKLAGSAITRKLEETASFEESTDTLRDIPLNFDQRIFAPRQIKISEV